MWEFYTLVCFEGCEICQPVLWFRREACPRIWLEGTTTTTTTLVCLDHHHPRLSLFQRLVLPFSISPYFDIYKIESSWFSRLFIYALFLSQNFKIKSPIFFLRGLTLKRTRSLLYSTKEAKYPSRYSKDALFTSPLTVLKLFSFLKKLKKKVKWKPHLFLPHKLSYKKKTSHISIK